MEWNDMRDGKVIVLQQKCRKNYFDENYKISSSAMTWRIIGSKFYSKKDENDKNNDLGENLLKLDDRIHVAQQKWLFEWTWLELLLNGMRWNTRGLGTHGNHDNVMLKVLDTANPTICYYMIRRVLHWLKWRTKVMYCNYRLNEN